MSTHDDNDIPILLGEFVAVAAGSRHVALYTLSTFDANDDILTLVFIASFSFPGRLFAEAGDGITQGISNRGKRLALTGTAEDLNAYLNVATLTLRADPQSTGQFLLYATLADSHGVFDSNFPQVVITLFPENLPPILEGQLDAQSGPLDTEVVLDLRALTFSEDLSARVSLELELQGVDGELHAASPDLDGIDISLDPNGNRGIMLVGTPRRLEVYLENLDNLTFQPAPGAHGTARIIVRLFDREGLAAGNMPVLNLMVNDVPTSTGAAVSTLEDTPYSFAAADFNFADVDDGDSLAAVRLDSLPDTGSLTLAGTAVTTAQEIRV